MISVELTILILISNFLFFVFLYNKIRKYKENLKIINQKYNSIQSMVTAGSWELDIVTQETHWSNEVFKIHKLPIGKKINKEEALAFYPEKDRIKLVNLLNKCISNNEDFDDIFEFIDAEGNKKFVRSIGKSIIDLKTNKVLKLIGSFQDVTNQIKKEKDLIISQNKHRQLFMQSQDAIMTLNPPTWKFTSCNPATLKLFQVKNEEDFTNMGPWNISPEFQPNGELSGFLAEQAIKKAMRDGVYQFEWIHQDINGKKIPCQVLLSKVKEDEKEYLQATVRDISKEQELLNQLSESKEYLALAVEGTNLGIWDWDLRDNSVRFDNKWAEMLGYNITEIKMELNTWSEKVHPDDLNNCYADIKKYLDKQTEYYENIHRMKHKNGHWVYILDRGRISKHDKDGNPIRFTGTHLDITELMLNKQKLDLFFNKSPYGFAFCDMNGKFIEINNEFEKITGYTKDELNSLSYWDLTPEKYKKDEDEQILSLQTKGFYGPYKKEYIRKNNELIPIKLNGFIVENPDGSKGIWSIIEDISSQANLAL